MSSERAAVCRPLLGQKALVTGANSGIGLAVAVGLGAAGADVSVNYVTRPEEAEAAAAEIGKAGTGAIAIQANVADESEVDAMFRAHLDRFGRIDILVANAGLQRDAPLAEMSLTDWNRVLAVNLTGQFLCCRAAVREMTKTGVVPGVSKAAGKIICMSSVHEAIPWAGHANYAASKGGIRMMMKSIAQEFAPHRVRINSIAPGAVRTPSTQRPGARPKRIADQPAGGLPWEYWVSQSPGGRPT